MLAELDVNRRFKLGFIVNTAFMLFEFAAGFVTGSLILIADATHNLTDSLTLAVSWAGNKLARKPADAGHTLGHGRISVLTALINSSILIGIAAFIVFEAYQRFKHPVPLQGGVIAGVAVIGVAANTFVARLFREIAKTDINAKAAYTNMAFDAIFSVASLIAGILIFLTNKTWIDPAISIGVVLGLLYAAFGITKQATNIFLEGVPANLDIHNLRNKILDRPEISKVNELYVWAVSSEDYILCCSVTSNINNSSAVKSLTKQLKQDLQKLGFAKVLVEVL